MRKREREKEAKDREEEEKRRRKYSSSSSSSQSSRENTPDRKYSSRNLPFTFLSQKKKFSKFREVSEKCSHKNLSLQVVEVRKKVS